MIENPTRILYPSNEDVVLLGKITENTKYSTGVLMTKFTEGHREQLEKTGYLLLKFPHATYSIDAKDIYLYGSISTKEDYDELLASNFKWWNDTRGSFVPGNYDYDSNTGDSYLNMKNEKKPKLVETFDNETIYKFGHARLGKPKEVIIFKQLYKNRS